MTNSAHAKSMIMNVQNNFLKMKSVEVTVEERQVTLEVSPGTWRTHVFSGLETVPDKLRPAFAHDGENQDVDLLDLVQKAYHRGQREVRHEAPYRDGKGPTVLRTIDIKIQYRRDARAPIAAAKERSCCVIMPMWSDGVWSNYEIQKAEQALGKIYSKVSASTIGLTVRLAKLDLRPSAGSQGLVRHAIGLMQNHRSPGQAPRMAGAA
jgi:hypothetical protein